LRFEVLPEPGFEIFPPQRMKQPDGVAGKSTVSGEAAE